MEDSRVKITQITKVCRISVAPRAKGWFIFKKAIDDSDRIVIKDSNVMQKVV